MSRLNGEFHQTFEELKREARTAIDRGHWDAALALYERTIAWAEAHGDKDACDMEHCNRSSILVAQGRGESVISELRKILLSSSNPEICHIAANNVSRFHEMRNQNQRGLFYARLSLDHARRTGKPESVARSQNQIGLLLVRDSYFEEARDCFGEALELLPQEPSRDSAIILYNLGYCHSVLGDVQLGFSRLFRSLRILKRHRGEVWELYPRLGLAYAYLEVERPVRAAVHARRGLLLAEDAGITWQVKNALYLLGESEKLSGDEIQAHRTFTRLQQEFYPEDPVIPDFLMATDVRKLINLMA